MKHEMNVKNKNLFRKLQLMWYQHMTNPIRHTKLVGRSGTMMIKMSNMNMKHETEWHSLLSRCNVKTKKLTASELTISVVIRCCENKLYFSVLIDENTFVSVLTIMEPDTKSCC